MKSLFSNYVPIIKLKNGKAFFGGPKLSPVQNKSTRLGLIGLTAIRASSPSNYEALLPLAGFGHSRSKNIKELLCPFRGINTNHRASSSSHCH